MQGELFKENDTKSNFDNKNLSSSYVKKIYASVFSERALNYFRNIHDFIKSCNGDLLILKP